METEHSAASRRAGLAGRASSCSLVLATAILLALLLGVMSASAIAASSPKALQAQRTHEARIALRPSKSKPHWACGHGPCEAIVDPPPVHRGAHFALPGRGPLLEGSGEKGGYDAQDLEAAYKIPLSGGSTQTIALVDAYGYSAAEPDLAKYRTRYGLPPCTKANGCFRKVNQRGEEGNYPGEGTREWLPETALDLEMASAACPECHILLVQASGEFAAETAESVNTAARLGANEISNSYGYAEIYKPWCGTTGCAQYSSDYDHPGVVVLASSGDSGYDDQDWGFATPNFPATSPYVVAVGGTSLQKAANARGWSEAVWGEASYGSGSGCSNFEAKPSWQTDTACAKRMDNDIAAVGACATPVSVYSSYFSGGWEDLCGTSVSTPLAAGIVAHESEEVRNLGPQAFYQSLVTLVDVTEGSNGTCTPPSEDEYFCHAIAGYDGPTGLGAPLGPAAGPTLTRVEPSEGPPAGGTSVTITGTNFIGVSAVKFGSNNATEFTVNSSTSITATSPAGSGSVDVQVTTPEGTSAANTGDRFSYSYSYPELGRCEKVANGTGAYGTATCTAPEDGGSYAWVPGVVKSGFKGGGGKSKLETVGKVKVKCVSESSQGAYAGVRFVSGVVITLHGCERPNFGSCASAGAASGEIVSNAMEGSFVWESRAERTVALDLYAPSQGIAMSLNCAGVSLEVRGSVLAHVTADKMTAALPVRYSARRGIQKPSQYESSEETVTDVLETSLLGGPFEVSGLTIGSSKFANEEALEVNAYA
jgi:IPT/TIG domain/Subtilase family